MGKLLETAKYWTRLGIAVIPLGFKSKQPRIRWQQYTEQLPTQNDIENWFASDLGNIGIVTGWQNLCIIDFDDMDIYKKWFFWAVKKGGTAKQIALGTRMHQSARGMHVYVTCENAQNAKLPKIDILAHRKYALLPPSLHPTGVPYQIYRNGFPMPVTALCDVLPKALLGDTQSAPSPNIPSSQSSTIPAPPPSANYDPWAESGKVSDRDSLVAEIKARIPITSILSGWEDSGGNGRWMLTRCPFHDDRNPSFWLDTQTQLCGCHAGCTPLPLDVIDLYARLSGITNEDAIRELAKRL